MKIWTLVWFLALPPSENGQVEWELGAEQDLTQSQCEKMLAEQDLQYLLMTKEKVLTGHEIFCRKETPDEATTKVAVRT